MEFPLIYTAIILVLMTAALVEELFNPAITVFTALLLLVFGNVITVDEAVRGFSNQGMLTVGFLFVVSAALQGSGSFERIVSAVLGGPTGGTTVRYLRLMFPVAVSSAFLNNTPVVAALIPTVKNWSRHINLPASKFLIPVSYAAILGGTCTLIGTSTNLVVHGMMLDHGTDGFSFFELTKVSLPVALCGILFISLVGHKLLPEKKDPIVQLGENTREFVVEMKVSREYANVGKTVEEANLRHLRGLFLFQINRGDEVIAPVSHDEKIMVGDRLFFTGLPESIYELQKTPGLDVIKDPEFDVKNLDSDRLGTYEAVISSNSDLIGENVRNSNFRIRYDAVILAIHRAGSRVNRKVGDIVFKPGDTLFILAKKGFDKRWYNQRDFSLVSSSLEIYSKPTAKGSVALVLLLVMVLLATFKIMPMILAAASTAALMVLTTIINPESAVRSIDWGVLLIIAASFGIGRGMENSGLATFIANSTINSLFFLGPAGIIAGVFFMTAVYTSLITNTAAAAIMFPIVIATANLLDLSARPLLITLAIAASASFATPIGYQTNLMVYGPGGYRFTDFLKIGVVITAFVGVAVIITVWLVFFRFGWF